MGGGTALRPLPPQGLEGGVARSGTKREKDPVRRWALVQLPDMEESCFRLFFLGQHEVN